MIVRAMRHPVRALAPSLTAKAGPARSRRTGAGEQTSRPSAAARLGGLAVDALVEEARLTPKPGLVDGRGSGCHADLDLGLMLRSAASLRPAFTAIAARAAGERPAPGLREELAAIGRDGERAMLAATGGSNAHRGAIWALGLLVAGAAMDPARRTAAAVAARAAALARLPDRFARPGATNGARARTRYGVAGAPGEARAGFPHVVSVGLPTLRRARARGAPEEEARLDALLAIMSSLDDTCLLHRGGIAALRAARAGARAALAAGGASSAAGRRAVLRLEDGLLALGASPGGSADCLAAVLFLDRLDREGAAAAPPRAALEARRRASERRG
jgi:triphosphoribosyl-dephospho-CoA synthase